MNALVDAALAWHDAGFCVLPASESGNKAVGLSSWKQYIAERPEREQVELWASTNDGIGLVMGQASGNAEMLEIEGKAQELVAPFLKAVGETSADLLARLMTYTEITPSGGYHWIYRVEGDPVAGNTKLAQRPSDPGPGRDTLMETRGEGGWVVTAPSGGSVHPTGRSWVAFDGVRFGVVGTVSAEERDTLHRIARTFDLMPLAPPVTYGPTRERQPGDPKAPGDDFNERATWEEILVPHDWQVHHREGEETLWTRPGKDRRHGWSARTGRGPYLWVFSSSTEFEPERTHHKFFAYAVLNHGGDMSAAAKALRGLGYGDDRPDTSAQAQAESRATLSLIQGGQTTSGANALAPEEKSSPVVRKYRLSDTGNAHRLIAVESPRLRYSPERAEWARWDGHRWAWVPGNDNAAAVNALWRLLEVTVATDDDEGKWIARSLNTTPLEKAARLARTDEAMQIHVPAMDADPYALNSPNGIVNLKTKELRPPDPSGLHSRSTGVPVDFGAACPRWLKFLADTFGDQALIDFVQKLAGYSATGTVTHHVLPFLHGAGANGKSVFLEVLMAILGSYADQAPADFLLAGADVHDSFMADLAGARLVVCNEVPPTAKFHEQKIKSLTGGDRIKARYPYGRPFSFTPTHHLMVAGNHQPRVDAGGQSLWRRLRLIHFSRIVPEVERIEGLAAQLVDEEGPAILAWVIEGAQRQLAGLDEPESVRLATSTYAEEEDHLGRFMDERVRFGGGSEVRMLMNDVYGAYVSWCFTEGEKEMTKSMFGRELKLRGAGTHKSGARRFYTNLTLVRSEEQTPDRTAHQLVYGD